MILGTGTCSLFSCHQPWTVGLCAHANSFMLVECLLHLHSHLHVPAERRRKGIPKIMVKSQNDRCVVDLKSNQSKFKESRKKALEFFPEKKN